MKKILSKLFKRLLNKHSYTKLKTIYHYLANFRSRNYNLSEDLAYNEKLFTDLKFDINKIKSRLKSLNYSYESENLSWHYHIFSGLKDYFKDKKINILEIGTFEGRFTNFISEVYKESLITTIDLNNNDEVFINSYGRNEKENLDQFFKIREKNISNKNINFINLNSTNIKKYFYGKKFDLIWIDGDHLNPQITLDIINSFDLLNEDGVICIDDIFKDPIKSNLVSNEGYLTLENLEKNKISKNFYLFKRINKANFYRKKFICISVFAENPNFSKNV